MSSNGRLIVGGWAPIFLFCSGWIALGHQVLWTRRLVDLLGASPETFSRVVGAFFLGLALGSAWAARSPAKRGQGWRRAGVAEIFVGIGSLAPLFIVDLQSAIPELGIWMTSDLGRRLVPVATVGSPAFAMGLVLPAVVEAISGDGRANANSARLYGWNTLGGLLGVISVYYAALPVLGHRTTGLLLVSLNVALAGVAAVRHAAGAKRNIQVDSSDDGNPLATRSEASVGAMTLAFGSGVAVLGLEVIVQQQFAQVTINSHASSAVVLAFVLLALAMAAFVSARRLAWTGVLAIAAIACATEPVLFLLRQDGLRNIPYELSPGPYFGRVALLGLATAVPLFFLTGLVFPKLLRGARSQGSIAGLLALNGLGGWLGTELAQEWLLPRQGIWRSTVSIGIAYAMAALGAACWGGFRTWMCARGMRSWAIASIPALLAGAWTGLVWLNAGRWPQVAPIPGDTVVEVGVGREGVVATVTGGTNDWRILFNNTYTLGGSRAQVNQERQALLPILIQAHAKDVAVLGFATGSTTAGAALPSNVNHVSAFELSPLVASMAERHFGKWNRDVLADPKVQLWIEDARLAISRRKGVFDVVIGDLFLPWRTGEGRLYTREHFAAVKKSLRPDGLFCQWLPLFQLTRNQFDIIARTFQREFPGGVLLRGDFYAELPIVGLCAFGDGRPLEKWDWSGIEEACRKIRQDGRTGDPLVRHVEGVAMCVLGPTPEMGDGIINTLGNARVEWDAGRNVVGLRSPWFIGVPWAEYARDRHRAGANLIPRECVAAHDAGQFFLTLEVAAVSGSRLKGNLEAQIGDRLPGPMLHDEGAAWDTWPGRIKAGISTNSR